MTTPDPVIDVRPDDRRDRKLIKLLLAHLGRLHRRQWASLDFPDERIHTRDAVHVIAMEPSGRVTAIEHVALDSFAGDTQDVQRCMPVFAALEREPSLRVPGFHIDVAVPIASAAGAVDPTLLATSLRGWCERHVKTMAVGHATHVMMVAKVPLRIQVEKIACPGEPGRLWVTRAEPPRNFEAVIQASLQHKLGRLVAASADRRLLLVEKRDGLWNVGQLRLELEGAGLEFPDLNVVTEVWLADSTSWDEDGYLAFRPVLRNDDE